MNSRLGTMHCEGLNAACCSQMCEAEQKNKYTQLSLKNLKIRNHSEDFDVEWKMIY